MLKSNPYIKSYLNIIKESSIDENPTEKQIKSIEDENHCVYIHETNTFDCQGNGFVFVNDDFNKNGSFTFKIINVGTNWSHMFEKCDKLKYLPEHFIIPQGVTRCGYMFRNCYNLQYLPTNFTIPNTVENCYHMFMNCQSLIQLPINFTVPQSVTNCNYMFEGCQSLTSLPSNFHVPIECNTYEIFKGCSSLDNQDIETYRMFEV